MERLRKPLLLKTKLIIYFMLIAIIPVSIMSIFYYINYQNTMTESIGENNFRITSQIMDNIDVQFGQANNFSDWIYSNSSTSILLNKKPQEAAIFDEYKNKLIVDMDNYSLNLPIMQYISSLFIEGDNGIDIRRGDAYLINLGDLENEDWYKKGIEEGGGIYWGKVEKNYTKLTSDSYVIPQIREIKDLNSEKIIGKSIVLFSTQMLEDSYSSIPLENRTIYITDKNGNIFSSNKAGSIGTTLAGTEIFSTVTKGKANYFQAKIDGIKELVVYKNSNISGWYTIEVIAMNEIRYQKSLISKLTLTILVVTVLIAILFSLYLSENFTRPIKYMVNKVNNIAQGNFNQKIQLKNDNEIGYLAKSIEKMSSDINELMEQSIKREEEKREIEIKMLYSQINPHFLYNTLNSIKMMATMQGATGISEMVGSLGKLLKSVVKSVDEKTSIGEEVEVLEDYIHIQRIRYMGKIQFSNEIEDKDLLNYSIIKFSLQPLVENAIFHGIEPKDCMGKITISIKKCDNRLIISIWDNGVGMSSKKIDELLSDEASATNLSKIEKIGFQNVKKRIKMIYGDEYGIDIESEEGKYTNVILNIPAEKYRIPKEEGDQIEGSDC